MHMLTTLSYICHLNHLIPVAALENCIRDMRAWMKEDMLWLNYGKTEFLLIGSR
jgi:hypothetical protein